MTQDSQLERGIQPFRLSRVPQWRREEIPLWNWYAAAFPSASDWRVWLRDVAAQLLRRPGRGRARIVKTNLVDPAAATERFVLEGEVLNIGRDSANEIVLPEATITRQHARLRTDGGSFFLEDMGSAMGTIAGGNKLNPAVPLELADGDSFVIFPHRFQLEVERDWLPAGDVAVSDEAAGTGEWKCFRNDCPAGWSLLAIHVEPLAASACVAIEDALLRSLVERALPPPAAWGAVEEAVTEVLLLAMLERANRDLALPFRFSLDRVRRQPQLMDDTRGVALRATLSIEGIRGGMRLFLPFDLLGAMQKDWPARPADTLARQSSWRFRVSNGSLDLTTAEQASLDPGDIVLYSPAPALLHPSDDRQGWDGAWDAPRRFRLIAKRKNEMPVFSATPTPFQDLPVRIQVVIDEHEITLADAERLAPGAVFDLDRDPREPVVLAVNGHVVGTGELVEIEGRMGVRILSWSRA